MWLAIKHGVRNTFKFTGRDSRQSFWFYVLFVYLVTTALSTLATLPALMNVMLKSFSAAIANPNAEPKFETEIFIATMTAMSSTVVWVGMATGIVLLVTLAASLVRRLQDAGMSGAWALLPAAMQVGSLSRLPLLADCMRQTAGNMTTDDAMTTLNALQASLNFGAVLGWGAIIAVVVLGTLKPSAGPNRFGSESFDVASAPYHFDPNDERRPR